MNKIIDIDVSLSQGQLYRTKHLIVLWLSMIISFLLIAMGIISLLLSYDDLEWNGEICFVGISCLLVGIGLLICMLYCLVKDIKTKKKVFMWLLDAEKTTAVSRTIDIHRAGLQPLSVKMSVEFSLGGLTYTRESSATCFGGKPGYLGVFRKYADKEIEILYSPKYDEVLILKAIE